MKETKQLLHHVQTYFQDYLKIHRGLSPNTIFTYRDAIKLFLIFLAKYTGKPTPKLSLDELDAEAVLAFLSEIEETRQNEAITRNLRLSALRTFFTYLAAQDPLRAGQYQRVISIPLKQSSHRIMEYLDVEEVKAILNLIDQKKANGRRDYVLLSLLYNTGAKVQEVCDLRVEDIQWEPLPLAFLTGKRRKTRQVPLWPETTALLKSYLAERNVSQHLQDTIFMNAQGGPLTRFGIHHIIKKRAAAAITQCPSLARKRIGPHTFRHTTAMHLLQSGVDLTLIKNWLGHVHLATTHTYVQIDLDMKRKVLSARPPLTDMGKLHDLVKRNNDIVCWLESL